MQHSTEPQRLAFQHSAGRASPVDVVRLSNLRARAMDHSMYDPTRLDFHQVHFVLAGDGAHWVDFRRVQLTAGDVLLVRPEQVHAFDADAEHEALLLFFLPSVLKRTLAQPPLPARRADPVLHPAHNDFGILTDLVQTQETLDAEAAQLRPASLGPQLVGAVLAGLADVVAAQHGAADPTTRRYEDLVQRFEALLDAKASDSRSPGDYAELLHTTPRTLARACQKVRGMAPKRMVDLRVALHAQRRLATSTETVEAIGYDLGFTEPTNFAKFFKRIAGVSPDAFRRSHAGG